jgi:hypothetical protein
MITWSEEKKELLKILAEAVKRASNAEEHCEWLEKNLAEEREWRREANEYKIGMTGYVNRLVKENMELRAQVAKIA